MENAKQINESKNYNDISTRIEFVEVPYDGNVTKCLNCAGIEAKGLGNCHTGCSRGNDEDKRKCHKMNANGYCIICGCPWHNHVNSINYYIS